MLSSQERSCAECDRMTPPTHPSVRIRHYPVASGLHDGYKNRPPCLVKPYAPYTTTYHITHNSHISYTYIMDPNKDANNSPGYDEEELVSTKIPPLDSPLKSHVGHEHTHGVIGEDYILQTAHIDPFRGSSDKHGASQQGGISPLPPHSASW